MGKLSMLRKSFAIARKDMIIFYFKGPVVIMGLLFPLFLFGAFLIGRHLSHAYLFVVLISMTAFFTPTAVGPTIIPWEARSRTFERLISSPVSITTVLLGDMEASFFFGLIITFFVSFIAVLLHVNLNPVFFISSVLLALVTFSSMTILMSSYPPTDIPADVMMLSSLVKFTLLFISGIFIPLQNLPWYARFVSMLSPLTYLVDALRHSANIQGFLPVWIDLLALIIFASLFFFSGVFVHKKVLEKRFT